MILESLILSWPGAHFKAGPWPGFTTICWDLKFRFWFLLCLEFIIRNMFQIWPFEPRNGSGLISNKFKIIPESFWSNFHIIFLIQGPKSIDFQWKMMKIRKRNKKVCLSSAWKLLHLFCPPTAFWSTWMLYMSEPISKHDARRLALGTIAPSKADRSERL